MVLIKCIYLFVLSLTVCNLYVCVCVLPVRKHKSLTQLILHVMCFLFCFFPIIASTKCINIAEAESFDCGEWKVNSKT